MSGEAGALERPKPSSADALNSPGEAQHLGAARQDGDGASPAPSASMPAAEEGVSQGFSSAVDTFLKGTGAFKTLLLQLLEAVDKEKQALASEREVLQRQRKQFEEDELRVQQVMDTGQQITLNVGGSRFTTSLTTLRSAPPHSLFNAMFSGRHELRPTVDGAFFIDRDGRHFHDILNYLRDASFQFPNTAAAATDAPDMYEVRHWCAGFLRGGTQSIGSQKYLMELRAEADFYGLQALVDDIDRYPWGLAKVQRFTHLNFDEGWMYEDGQDELVLRVDKRCQLVGVGLCGTDGGYAVDLEVLEVDPAADFQDLEKLHEQSQTFTKDDGQVVRMMLTKVVELLPERSYMLSALIKGTESFCCEDCLETVIASGVRVQFLPYESANGTNELRGQFPELYIRPLR